MKKIVLSMLLLTAMLSVNAQVTLNSFGEYEYKQVHQYAGVPAEALYQSTLVALSDINNGWDFRDNRPLGSGYYKVDSGGIIVFRDNIWIDIDNEYFQSYYTLKVRFKEGRAQYTFTVNMVNYPHWGWSVAMKDMTPDHKERIIRKYHTDIIDFIDKKIKSLYQDLVNFTQLAINDSNF